LADAAAETPICVNVITQSTDKPIEESQRALLSSAVHCSPISDRLTKLRLIVSPIQERTICADALHTLSPVGEAMVCTFNHHSRFYTPSGV
jgi:hypothetical protein